MSTQEPVNFTRTPAHSNGAALTPLARRIIDDIRARGPITFRDFMERALYEPDEGYYTRAETPWRAGADFVTGPQVHAAFGAAVARLAAECDAALANPDPFDLIECGGGDGSLLADACDALAREAPNVYARLRACVVERGPGARAEQQHRLAAHAGRLEHVADLAVLPASSRRGLVVSNELLDALPVHRVTLRCGVLEELYVDVVDGVLAGVAGPPSTPALGRYIEDNGIELAEQQVAELCLAVQPWIESVARALRCGFVLTIDYGADTAALFGEHRRDGSLVCQRRFQANARPFEYIGQQDITAHVDFGNLRRRGAECGLQTVGESGLATFLVGFGAAESVVSAPANAEDVRWHLGVRHLLFSEISDAHRALLQRKAVTPIPFGLDRLSSARRPS